MTRPPPTELARHQLPARVHDLQDPPEVAWLWGQLSAGPAVAVVGTREPTREAVTFTRALVHDLGRAGVSILSGGAVGIDGAAHEAALDVGAHTLVVAPAGLSKPYPVSHEALFSRILRSGGGYLSITPDGEQAELWAFFRRNAVLAALAHVVVAVEASARSGTRNTTARARRLGRPIFWPAAPPWDRRRAGFLIEYRLGGVEPLRDARDVLRCLSAQRLHALPGAAAQLELGAVWEPSAPSEGMSGPRERALRTSPMLSGPAGPLEQAEAVLTRLARHRENAAALSSALSIPAHELERVLIQLTLEGQVERDARGCFRSLAQNPSEP